MELRDLIVTPLLIIIILVIAYVIRPYVTDGITRRYFIPALVLRIVGALAVGFIYQFYYSGGDTFNYHTHGSRLIWKTLVDDPQEALALIFSPKLAPELMYKYSELIWYISDPQSYFVIRITALLDIFTFSSYTGTAVLFAVISLIGAWLFFRTFVEMYPTSHRWLALSILFVPTVTFWGAGIFKDSLTLAALGIATFAFHRLFIKRSVRLGAVVMLLLAMFVIYSIKKYILLCLLPAMLAWMFVVQLARVRSLALRLLLVPLASVALLMLAYFAISSVARTDERYGIYRLAHTARITAYDIRYGWGARSGEGSGYSLGELDGTWQGMLELAPQAINVSLFRPYIWEVRNPLMLLSALESLALLTLTLFIIFRTRLAVFKYLRQPHILFCMVFSLSFAFAVGVSTYNFGTLSRYKIPLMPFFTTGLVLCYHYWNKERNLALLASDEYR